ncbi:MAG: YfhO family protein [candidate division WOR-3 bacterium]|nr:YfhO family protein [candidate division WOR-3 bacterium]MCX7837654.1 YfhO family protein [candidate division WOR-3 bacterium]MDW8114021.1 YfhO family protein [candidate division WOR-3 bacterium]
MKKISKKEVKEIKEISLKEKYLIILLFLIPVLLYFEVIFSNRMLFGTDWLLGGLPNREFIAEYLKKYKEIAQWLPYIYSGLPTTAGFFADLFYPTTFFRLFIPTHIVWTWTFVLHLFLAGLGTYLFLKELEINKYLAFLGGIGYMLSGSLVSLTYAGHDGRLICSALLPLILYFYYKGLKSKKLYYFIFAGGFVALQLFSGHIQKGYYTTLFLFFLFIYHILKERKLKIIFYSIIMAIFIIFFVAIQYLPIYRNLPYGARGEERGYSFATSWSLPPEEIFDLITPDFSGGLDFYWGRNAFKLHSEYFSIFFILLFFLTLYFYFKKPIVKFFFIYTCFGLLMAFGGHTPFYYLPYYLLPGINKFRGPSMIFFTVVFSMIILGIYGLSLLLKETFKEKELKKLKKFLLTSSLVLIFLTLFILIFKQGVISLLISISKISGEKITNLQNNYPRIQQGFLFASFLWIIFSLLIYNLIRKKIKLLTFMIIAGLILIFDLVRNDIRYIKSVEAPETYYATDEVVEFLKQDNSLYRVFPLFYKRSDDGLLMRHNIQSVGGHHPNPLQSYQEFIGLPNTVMFSNPPHLYYKNFLNLLSVKYVIVPKLPKDLSLYDEQTKNLILQIKNYLNSPFFKEVFSGREYNIYKNLTFLERAFLVPYFSMVKDKEEIFEILKREDFDCKKLLLLYEKPEAPESLEKKTYEISDIPLIENLGSVRLLEYKANKISLEVEAERDCFLVLSENYYPDWKAKVNNKEIKVLRTFHTLRAIFLNKGKHKIKFYYYSKYYQIGKILSLLALFFLIFNIIYFVNERKRGIRT